MVYWSMHTLIYFQQEGCTLKLPCPYNWLHSLYTNARTHAHAHTQTHTYTHTHTHKRTHTCTHAQMHTCTHNNHMHKHTHVYIHNTYYMLAYTIHITCLHTQSHNHTSTHICVCLRVLTVMNGKCSESLSI